MHPSQTRRVLLIAFAISLLIHLVGARYLRFEMVPRNDRPELVTLSKKRVISVVRATPHPIPTQMPTPLRTPRPRLPVRTKPSRVARQLKPGNVGPPHGKAIAAAPPAPAPVPVTASPSPVPTATPAGACPQANASPAVAATPPPPDITPDARAKAVSGVAAVTVKLDSAGRVLDAAVAQSSGSGDLDLVAVSMARSSTYTPKYVACKGVASEYTFTVRFSAW